MSTVYTLKPSGMENFELKHYLQDNNETFDARKFPPHIHDGTEFYVLLEGDVSFMVENALYKLSAGDVLVTKPNELHNCVLNSRTPHRHLCFWFSAEPEFLFAPFTERPFGEGNLISLTDKDREVFLSVCFAIHRAAEAGNILEEYYQVLKFLRILRAQSPVNLPAQSIPKLLQEILDDINENFTRIDTLDYFTEKYFVSQSTLHRLFAKHLHVSPKTYVESKRLAYSRVLLKQGYTVLDACMQSGFPDYSNYIRLFRKRFGVTPKKYQEN